MKATAEFPYVFPPLWFYWKVVNADLFFVADNLKVPKRPRVNRYTVIGAGGPCTLTVPVHRPRGWLSDLVELEVVAGRFADEHLRVLRNEMANAPYLELYLDEIALLLSGGSGRYVDFATRTIRWLADKLGVTHMTWLWLSSLCGREKIDACLVRACRAQGAETYVMLEGMKDVRDERFLEGEGIRVERLALPEFRYRSLCGYGSWETSALDFLLNYGPEAGLRLRTLAEGS